MHVRSEQKASHWIRSKNIRPRESPCVSRGTSLESLPSQKSMRKHKNYSKTRLKKTCLLGWRNRTQATQQNSELPHREDPYFSCKRKGHKENSTKIQEKKEEERPSSAAAVMNSYMTLPTSQKQKYDRRIPSLHLRGRYSLGMINLRKLCRCNRKDYYFQTITTELVVLKCSIR